MNWIRATVCSGLVLGLVMARVSAAEPVPPQGPECAESSDPIAELRNHDDAFALLLECFRQLQTNLIEADFEARLDAAANLPEAVRRAQVIELAHTERELRFEKLQQQLVNLLETYRHARARDAREAGVDVPMRVDTVAAARKLENFVAIVPAHDPNRDIVVTRVVPASLFLRPNRRAESEIIPVNLTN
ncbi:MAG: hypothetical protein RMM51_02755 [Verrucomicrobiae bacterium]|nr:hypothetical protein [Verrucomicrobiae bacterium]